MNVTFCDTGPPRQNRNARARTNALRHFQSTLKNCPPKATSTADFNVKPIHPKPPQRQADLPPELIVTEKASSMRDPALLHWNKKPRDADSPPFLGVLKIPETTLPPYPVSRKSAPSGRYRQLLALVNDSSSSDDNRECAAGDIFLEFPEIQFFNPN